MEDGVKKTFFSGKVMQSVLALGFSGLCYVLSAQTSVDTSTYLTPYAAENMGDGRIFTTLPVQMLPTDGAWDSISVKWDFSLTVPYGECDADWFGFSLFDATGAAVDTNTWFPQQGIVVGSGMPELGHGTLTACEMNLTTIKEWTNYSRIVHGHSVSAAMDTPFTFVNHAQAQETNHYEPRSAEVKLIKIRPADSVDLTFMIKKGDAVQATLRDRILSDQWSIIAANNSGLMRACGRSGNYGTTIIWGNRTVTVNGAIVNTLKPHAGQNVDHMFSLSNLKQVKVSVVDLQGRKILEKNIEGSGFTTKAGFMDGLRAAKSAEGAYCLFVAGIDKEGKKVTMPGVKIMNVR
jgi:hypothetical protein